MRTYGRFDVTTIAPSPGCAGGEYSHFAQDLGPYPAMRSTSGVMPDFAIDATAGNPDEWTLGGDDDSCLIHSACGTLSRWTAPRARSAAHPTGFARTGLIRL